MPGFSKSGSDAMTIATPSSRPPAAQTPSSAPMTQFRVHLANGFKHDVLAASPIDAIRHTRKRYPDIRIIRAKVIREEVSP